MKQKIVILFLFLFPLIGFSQIDGINPAFTIRGSVKGKENKQPIPGVEIRILGYSYNGYIVRTNLAGQFLIKVRIGDEIVISGQDIETITHTIKDNQDIEVLVEGYESDFITKKKVTDFLKTEHRKYIDSAKFYQKKNIEKSIDHIENSLTILANQNDRALTAVSFATLANIYFYWKQYDLAIDNYLSAIKSKSTIPLRIKLGRSYLLNGQVEQSEKVFKKLRRERRLTVLDEIRIIEGQGDVYNAMGDESLKLSIENYQEALSLAKDNELLPQITNLNSKLADTYDKINEPEKAQIYYQNSLNLAEKENPERSIQEKSKVADFLNKNRLFDREIDLRRSALKEFKKLEKPLPDSVSVLSEGNIAGRNDTIITPQKINYKIANAFIAQDKLEEAIPYLEESISEADKKEDLVVKKDATRKLSEVYENVGEYTKALESYQDYVQLVDELYIRKEQEISQVTRFSRDIALKQNRITSLEKDKALYIKDQELIQESNKRQQIIIYSLVFGMFMLTLLAIVFYRNNRQQKWSNNLLALKSLRSQMNPHFIFNALNSVNNFIAKSDERSANRYLSEFSTLMRSVLENSDENFIPLQKEIDLLSLYTKLEHSRFAEKFEYDIVIDKEIKIADFKIPPMLLQPYVENAIWHGLRYKEVKGWLKIHFSSIDNENIRISIEDNGVGRAKSKSLKTENQRRQKSKGMGNIKRRIAILNEMYKDRIDVYVENMFKDETGTRVVLSLKRE